MSVDPPDSVVSGLLDELEREAELVDHGALVIDAQRGLAKLGRHQLADPYHYVLRLAEAGVRFGSDELWFWTTRRSLIAHFVRSPEPVTLPASMLEDLFMVLFETKRAVEQRPALVQLAVAANTARRLEPKQLWIESVGADGRGHRLRLEGPEPSLEAIDGAEPGLWFRLRARRRSVRARPERDLLLARATWSSTPIYVDNKRIGYGFAFSGGVPITGASGETIGCAGLSHRQSLAPRFMLILCSAGIEVERYHGADVNRGLFAVLEADLERDASYAHFIRGPAFDALVERALAAGSQADLIDEALIHRRWTDWSRKFVNSAHMTLASGFVLSVIGVVTYIEPLIVLAFMMIMVAPFMWYIARRMAQFGGYIVGPEPQSIAWSARRRPALPSPGRPPRALPASSADG